MLARFAVLARVEPRRVSVRVIFAALAAALIAGPACAQQRQIDRVDYADRLRAMWLGEAIANWTGIPTEGRRTTAPFLTDADWGHPLDPGPPPSPIIDFVTNQDPWWADDDTDIEYVYLHLLNQHQTTTLSGRQIADGWIRHINHHIWVSNERARYLMSPAGGSLAPPMTSNGANNDTALHIDAQLTTEFFGALAPGMPEKSLAMAQLPIRATATGYAAHASQFYVLLYSLATQVDPALSGRDKVLWLTRQARKFIPDSSKVADITDFVLADFLANPDVNDWERTRDLVYDRYQGNAAAHGWYFRGWTESAVNFACGLIALLYGESDYRRTVQIGALSGWDSDNGTATMGGLMGLMLGYDALSAQFPGVTCSDRFWVTRTRDDLPDYLPLDTAAEDTFTLMAARMLPIIDRVVAEAGGCVRVDGADEGSGAWLLPPGGAGDWVTHAQALTMNPVEQEATRSANTRVRLQGGTANAAASPLTTCCFPYFFPSWIADAFEVDPRGLEVNLLAGPWFSNRGSGAAAGAEQSLTVTYDRPVEVHTVRFIEGPRSYDGDVVVSGWFETLRVEARIGGAWTVVPTTPSEPLDAARAFQLIDFTLDTPVVADAIRIVGTPGGGGVGGPFITCCELDALAGPIETGLPSFDLNHNGRIDTDDLYAWFITPTDLNLDAAVDVQDVRLLRSALRWIEAQDVLADRR